MKEIRFSTQILTIISADIVRNTDYTDPFYELHLVFDKEEYNWRYALEETKDVVSDIGIVQRLSELLKCRVAEMNGRKLQVLLYNTTDAYGQWIDGWGFAGWGSYNSDRFMDGIYEEPIMKRAELKRNIAKREVCTEINRCW